jgi:serine phosphatase RsbU (regulator of sigma subunit)
MNNTQIGTTLPAAEAAEVAKRAQELLAERTDANARRTDRLFAGLMAGEWVFGIILALTLSPYSWAGKTRSVHVHVPVAFGLGLLINALPFVLVYFRPGAPITRYTIAAAQMLWSALLIHLTGGRIETHFHVFGSLAMIAFYRDWRVLVPATVVVAADHLVRQIFWPESVYGIVAPENWRFVEHAFWVVFEDGFLVVSCVVGADEMKRLATQHAHLEISEQRERELEIATRIQTALLPREPKAPGLEIMGRMIPAAEVGGDYYDVLPARDGCWFGIGDVAGHGLEAGLVMLQAQSAVKALVAGATELSPAAVLAEVNRVVYDNARRGSGRKLHMTLSIARYWNDGRLEIAGAHQDIIIYRAETRRCEPIETRGTWIGLVPDISDETDVTRTRLAEGDVLILYTDGLTEAGAHDGEGFGVERLCATIEAIASPSAERIRDVVLDAVSKWAAHHPDDVTLVVAQRRAERMQAAA